MKAADVLEKLLSHLPWGAEIDYALFRSHGRGLPDHYYFRELPGVVKDFSAAAAQAASTATPGKKIVIFSTTHYWLEHTTLLGLALAGQGHQVTLAHLPYADWYTPVSRFILRRRELYIHEYLQPATELLKLVLLPASTRNDPLPPEIQREVEHISLLDAQYTLLAENIDPKDPVYLLRLERNHSLACRILEFLQENRPDIVLIPSGTILEFGVVYTVATHLGIQAITYEFSEKGGSLWVAQNDQVMHHNIEDLLTARKDTPFTPEMREKLRTYLAERQMSQRNNSLALVVQGAPRQGEAVRQTVGLDDRPIVLIATNVLGDALTLDRQIFSQSMTEWFLRTLDHLTRCTNVQVVVRIHPGESLVVGPSISRSIDQNFPHLPAHIHIIGAKEKLNTYDLMDIANLGLVYTTTAGLEMSLRGIPVVTGGRTHYRGRGFTVDVDNWEAYFATLDRLLLDLPAHRLTPEQLDLAWNYAYHFFLEFPRPYPWHLYNFGTDLTNHPMKDVLGKEGLAMYGKTFGYLAGEPLDWKNIQN